MIPPDTELYLLDTPLTQDQTNQLTFSNGVTQLRYFLSLPSLRGSDFTYQRENGLLRFPGYYEDLKKYNYCIYANPAKSNTNPWIFCFIEDFVYLNDEVTGIKLKTDVWQTYQFAFKFNPSFIEREHVNNDTIGLHTLPEDLELGRFQVDHVLNLNFLDRNNMWYALQVTDFPNKAKQNASAFRYLQNDIPTGTVYLLFQKGDGMTAMNDWIEAYASEGKQDAILSVFPAPTWLFGQPISLPNDLNSNTYYAPSSTTAAHSPVVINVQRNQKFGTYQPKNNKLFTYPYSYFYFDNHTGSSVEYRYEDFPGLPAFEITGAVNPGGEYRLQPVNIYNDTSDNMYAYGLSMSGTPLGSWSNDVYANWLAMNNDAINIQAGTAFVSAALQGGTSLGQAMYSMNPLNVVSAAAGAIGNIVDAQAKIMMLENSKTVAAKMPDQARGNTACQALTYALDKADGAFYSMCITEEYAKIIDDTFSMFGYSVNALKIPNITGRQNWNYVKSPDMNITGNVPQSALEEMKSHFIHGITFWHHPDTMFDYSQNNSIVL